MSDPRGVFTLRITNFLRKKEQWVDLNDVWHSPPTPNTGYYAGGDTAVPATVSTIEKVDFSTDTLSPAPVTGLSLARTSLSATGNVTDGYFGGGYFPGFYSTMDKLTYSTDNTVAAPGANLFLQVAGSAASGNQTNGYFGGGYDIGAGADTSSFTKIQYSDDTRIAVPTTQLNSARNDLSAMGNESSGYFIGGRNPSEVSTIDKLFYSVETCFSSPSLQYPESYRISGAVGNPAFGMVAGGRAGSLIYDTVRKLDYSTDNFSNVPALPVGKFGVASFGNDDFAYFGGGRAVPAITSDFVKIQYSTSTYSPVSNLNLGAARYQGASSGARSNGLSSIKLLQDETTRYIDGALVSPNLGYFGGGFPGPVSTVDKTSFANDTTARAPSANLTVARYGLAATGNSTHGYFGGGIVPGNTYKNTMDKITYATDTTVALSPGNLDTARGFLDATGNSDAGYFAAGATPTKRSNIEKITYSTDTTGIIPARLSVIKTQHAATGNQTHGYFGGGQDGDGNYLSTMDKITYVDDTRATVPGANLTSPIAFQGATGNSTHGYFGGGNPGPKSTMDKVTYSTDTTAAAPSSANLSAPRRSATATGNSTHGYFGAGVPAVSTIDKIDYSTDTTATLPSGANLSNTLQYHAAVGNREFGFPGFVDPPTATPSPGITIVPTPNTGYFVGGIRSPSIYSIVDKISFSSDTTARVPGANLSTQKYDHAATGNKDAGYFGGGRTSSGAGAKSTMDKTTYSSDTTAAVPGANLSQSRYQLAATGNSTHGYFGGGYYPSQSSKMDKLTYSTDTTAYTPSANLTSTENSHAATGNLSNGYFSQGNTLDRVVYASDTTATLPSSANLSSNRYSFAATSNSTAGYFGGGSPGYSSRVDKITYSSNTTARIPGANLISVRSAHAATGNSEAGFFSGGLPSIPDPATSLMDKITYSTDTTAALPSGANLSEARYSLDASGARDGGRLTAIPTSNTL